MKKPVFLRISKMVLCFTLILTMVLSIAGCGESGTEKETASTAANSTATVEKTTAEATTVAKVEPTVPELPKIELSNKEVKFFSWYAMEEENPARPFYTLFKEKYGGTIKTVMTTHEEYYTHLAALVSSGDSPDLIQMRGWDFYPTHIIKGLAANVDGLVDFNTLLWKDVKEANESAKFNGKSYIICEKPADLSSYMLFNREMFENAGLTTPDELYKNGEWTLDKMKECAIALSKDADQDGVADQVGLSVQGTASFLPIAQEPLIKYENGQFVNNTRNPKIATVMNVAYDLGQAKAIEIGYEQFKVGKAAMIIFPPWGHQEDFKDFTAKGIIGMVPYPKLDANSEHIKLENVSGYGIGPNAKNIDGAVTIISCARYVNTDYFKENDAEYKAKLAQRIPQVVELDNLMPDMFGKLKAVSALDYECMPQYNDAGIKIVAEEGENFSTAVEKVYPVIQKMVDDYNAALK